MAHHGRAEANNYPGLWCILGKELRGARSDKLQTLGLLAGWLGNMSCSISNGRKEEHRLLPPGPGHWRC